MNRHYISRFVLMIVLLLGVCARGWADGETVIFSEDFKNLGNGPNIPNYGDWTLVRCESMYYFQNGTPQTNRNVLKIDAAPYANQQIGSATTAIIEGMTSNMLLSFSYANAQKDNTGTFSVKISTGTFVETESDTYLVTTIENSYDHYTQTLHIQDAGSSGTITFQWKSGNSFALSSVVLTTVPPTPVDLTLSSSESNATTLSDNAGKLANVTIGRTFPTNTWCTLCLPFEVTASSIGTACGTDAPRLRVFSGVEGNTMKFTPPENDAVSAGTPFLLKFTTAVTSNPVFNGVTISKTGDAVTPAAKVTHEGYEDYSFIGTYSPTEIPAAGWFLKADGKLYQPGPETVGGDVNRTLPGLRAYFTLPTTTSGARPVVSIADDNATTVGTAVSTAPSVEAIYTLGGLPVASPKSPGIYIVRRTDGSTQKVTIR